MRKVLLLITVLLIGCTSQRPVPPTAPNSPESAYGEPQTVPEGRMTVIPIAGGWTVRQVHPAGYIWRADDSAAVAFRTGDGLWSVSADGQTVTQVAAGDVERVLLTYTGYGLYYLEKGSGGVTLWRWTADSGAAMVAQLGPELPWYTVAGSLLLYAPHGGTIHAVDLAGGNPKDLGGEPVDAMNGEFAASNGGRYLTYQLANRGDAVRVINVLTGAARAIAGEAHLAGATWSRTDDRWAVRAAEPGSGQPAAVGANLEEGATHVDVGTPTGEVRHLAPPERTNLTAGPWWSPDSRRLAVMAEPPQEGQPGPVWVVDVATNAWTKLAPGAPFYVTGWTPDGRYLTTHAAGTLLPVDGSPMIQNDNLLERATLPDGSTVDLMKDGAVTHRGVQLLGPEPGLRERLTATETHAALFTTRAGEPTDLTVLSLK